MTCLVRRGRARVKFLTSNLHGLPHILSIFKTVFGVARLVLLIRAFPGLLMRDEPVHLVIFICVMNRLLDAHIGT